MSEILGNFLKFNKIVGLNITNFISTQLKVGLCISDFSGGVKEYQSCKDSIPRFSFFSQFGYQNRGILLSIDSKIITLGTQRCFGGKMDLSQVSDSTFTFAENFFGKQVIATYEKIFEEIETEIQLNKIDYFLDRSHLFFSDEKVLFIEMKCTVDGSDAGSIHMIYPLMFVKQEQEKWQNEVS